MMTRAGYHLDTMTRMLAFMREKGILEEWIDLETKRALGTNPVPDAAITQPEEE